MQITEEKPSGKNSYNKVKGMLQVIPKADDDGRNKAFYNMKKKINAVLLGTVN